MTLRADRSGVLDTTTDVAWLAARAAIEPARPAVVADGRITSYADLDRQAERIAAGLRTCGLASGARVAVLAAPSAELVALVHACQRAGLVLAPMNLRLTTAELGAQIAHLAPALVVHDEQHAAAAACAGSTERSALEELVAGGASAATGRPPSIDLDAPATIVFTSGTTARPKGVVHAARHHLASARAVIANLRLGPEDAWLAALPLYHVGGLAILYRSVLAGSAVVLDDASSIGADRGPVRPTIASLVPTQLARLLDSADHRAPGAKITLVLGGGPCPPGLVERAEGEGFEVVTSYGMTETASQVAASARGDAVCGEVGAGRPLEGVEIRIGEPDVAGVGEILVRAPQVMLGYLDDAEATRAVLGSGLLGTGDLGRVDEQGRLHVFTRREDLIVTGGENVVPEEVERVLAEHPDVADAAVFGRPDDAWGQIVVAAVVAGGPGTDGEAAADARARAEAALAEELRDWCRGRLAGYKVPRVIRRVASLPRSPGGKLLRRELIDRDG